MNYKNIKKELDRLSVKYQAGGRIDERGRKIMDTAAKENFNRAVQFEKEYLLGNKAKERLLNLGLDPNTEIPTLWNKLSTVTLGVDNSSDNNNGAYYEDFGNSIKYSNGSANNVNSDTMNHEVGHIFGRANIRNSDMIDNRNAYIDQNTMGGLWQKVKNTFSSEYSSGEGHEADWQELVADVHAARQELVGTGYDGRKANFTNEAYNSMRRYANQMPDSASGRLFFKVGTPETSKYRMLKTQMEYQKIPLNKLPKEDQDFIQDYEKNKKKYEDTQKRYMFDVMNKIVSNDTAPENIEFAKLGGLIKKLKIENKRN